jgi:hypothetical protein
MRRDDDLVGAEGAKRVLHCLQRVAVADLAARLDTELAQPREARVQPLLGLRAGVVHVRGEGSDGRVQRRSDDQHLRGVVRGVLLDPLPQRLASDGLVGDHEDAPLVRVAVPNRRRLSRRLLPAGPPPPPEHDDRQHDEDREAEPAVDHARDRDQPEVDRRAQQELERLGLGPKGILHS